jgi:hypothetical protein
MKHNTQLAVNTLQIENSKKSTRVSVPYYVVSCRQYYLWLSRLRGCPVYICLEVHSSSVKAASDSSCLMYWYLRFTISTIFTYFKNSSLLMTLVNFWDTKNTKHVHVPSLNVSAEKAEVFPCTMNWNIKQTNKQTPWSDSASELYRLSDRRFSAKWLPTFADKGCHVVSGADRYGPYSRVSRQEPLHFYQVAFQLCSRGSVAPVPDTILVFFFFFFFRKSGSAGNRTRASGSVGKNSIESSAALNCIGWVTK